MTMSPYRSFPLAALAVLLAGLAACSAPVKVIPLPDSLSFLHPVELVVVDPTGRSALVVLEEDRQVRGVIEVTLGMRGQTPIHDKYAGRIIDACIDADGARAIVLHESGAVDAYPLQGNIETTKVTLREAKLPGPHAMEMVDGSHLLVATSTAGNGAELLVYDEITKNSSITRVGSSAGPGGWSDASYANGVLLALYQDQLLEYRQTPDGDWQSTRRDTVGDAMILRHGPGDSALLAGNGLRWERDPNHWIIPEDRLVTDLRTSADGRVAAVLITERAMVEDPETRNKAMRTIRTAYWTRFDGQSWASPEAIGQAACIAITPNGKELLVGQGNQLRFIKMKY